MHPEDACNQCGTPTQIHLLDAKPPAGADPDGAEWSILLCERCYGPGYLPGDPL